MKIEQSSWAPFLARATALTVMISVGVFVSVRFAMAVPGEPVRKALTVSGVLMGAPASTRATFRFYRAAGDTTPLCAPEIPIRDGMERVSATGAFSVEVPLDQAGHVCPDTLFHDPSAFVEVAIGATVVVSKQPINPVPYAVYAQQYGTPDCPAGYRVIERVDTVDGTVCARSRTPPAIRSEEWYDEIVRVGSGATAFWIDRFEASLWADSEGRRGVGGAEGVPFGTTDVLPSTFPANGQWSRPDGRDWPPTVTRLWALSVRGVLPSAQVTWFQAQSACRLSGKRLPSREEWLAAAQGHSDPGSSSGTDASCLTSGTRPRRTGLATGAGLNCQSVWGAQDMVGNVSEWVDEWYASPPTSVWPAADAGVTPFPSGYRDDYVFGVTSGARVSGSAPTLGLPSATMRGGSWVEGASAGVFSMNVAESPTYTGLAYGFRCVIPR